MQALLEQFSEQGFVVLPSFLSRWQVSVLNEAVDESLLRYPEDWWQLSDSFRQAPNVLPRTVAFDFTIEQQPVLDLVAGWYGEDISFEEFSILVRDPTMNLDEAKGWHRDITRDYSRRTEIDAVSLVFLLTDVGEQDHCFSIIPGSHDRWLDLRPNEHRPEQEFDIIAPARLGDSLSRAMPALRQTQTAQPSETESPHLLFPRRRPADVRMDRDSGTALPQGRSLVAPAALCEVEPDGCVRRDRQEAARPAA